MPDKVASWSFRVATPDGTMTVFVLEDENNNPTQIDTFIGKAGSAVAAWSAACSAMVSLAMKHGVPLQDIINELADITSDGTARIGASTTCRSGPEGIYSALIQYRNTQRDERADRERKKSEFRAAIEASREATERLELRESN